MGEKIREIKNIQKMPIRTWLILRTNVRFRPWKDSNHFEFLTYVALNHPLHPGKKIRGIIFFFHESLENNS